MNENVRVDFYLLYWIIGLGLRLWLGLG